MDMNMKLFALLVDAWCMMQVHQKGQDFDKISWLINTKSLFEFGVLELNSSFN